MRNWLSALCAIFFCFTTASAQVGQIPGWPPIQPVTGGGGYTGPGDSQAYVMWGSVARAYSTATAVTSTNFADLVDSSAPTVVICTLRSAATGLADLSAYCPGSTTPAAKCAAATGGVCNISKLYDQFGANNWVQTTAAKQPTLVFNGINGLPSMLFTRANSQVLASGAITTGQPFTFETVVERTGTLASAQDFMSAAGTDTELFFNNAPTVAVYSGAVSAAVAAADNAAHVVQATVNSVTSTVNVDGVSSGSTNAGNSGIGAAPLVLGGFTTSGSFDGLMSEAGMYAGTFSSGVQTNARTRYGL